jgi:3-dehydroquinate synthase
MNINTLGATSTVNVEIGARRYPIRIGAGLLDDLTAIVAETSGRPVIVTNTTIFPLYGESLVSRLREAGKDVLSIVLADGESHKDWQTLNQIFDALLAHACDRKTTLIALGGGVIGDMTGFAAATYQRGIPFIQIPTTLLAQVDSSVGGKTAINHPLGKNMIGAFYQPRLVVIDTDTLNTLPPREYRSGLAEVIKYGIALDRQFFEWLETNIDALNRRDATALTYAIKRSCEIKAAVVADDEHETKGGRALLNFGHTFGHAIETAMGYGVWLHGEAVACGMVQATQFSHALGRIDAETAERITALIAKAGLPITTPDISAATMLEHMSRDKKNEAGTIHLILLNALAKSVVDGTIARQAIADFLTQHKK